MFNGSLKNSEEFETSMGINKELQAVMASSDSLIGIEEVQKSLNRSRASVYRYTNTDIRNVNPPFNPRKLNPEYRTDQKDPLLFHPNEVARFAKDILRIKEVNVEILNSPSTVTQNVLNSILEELRAIRVHLENTSQPSQPISKTQNINDRSVA